MGAGCKSMHVLVANQVLAKKDSPQSGKYLCRRMASWLPSSLFQWCDVTERVLQSLCMCYIWAAVRVGHIWSDWGEDEGFTFGWSLSLWAWYAGQFWLHPGKIGESVQTYNVSHSYCLNLTSFNSASNGAFWATCLWFSLRIICRSPCQGLSLILSWGPR